jgi:hypothetical protein
MANVKDDEFDEEDVALCAVTVRKADEAPMECGLERPCPIHEYDLGGAVRPRDVTPMEWTSMMLGERRDV